MHYSRVIFWRAALFAALAFTATAAAAQVTASAPKCWPEFALPITFQQPGAAQPVKVGEIVYAASPIGLIWGYACIPAPGDTVWYHVVSGGTWADFPTDWLSIADALLRGTPADRSAAWLKYATSTTVDARLQPDVDAIKAVLPRPPPPPAEIWKVLADPFRADKKRLVYTVVAAKRGIATTQLVPAGDPCDPAIKIVEPGPVYFLSVFGNSALVARCVKQ